MLALSSWNSSEQLADRRLAPGGQAANAEDREAYDAYHRPATLFHQGRAHEAGMNQPILFVSHWGVQPGALDQLRQLSEEVAARFRAEKPRTLSWLAYLNDSGTSISFVHLFADGEAMDLHIEAAAAGRKASKDLVEPRGWEIYGSPSDSALDQMRRTAEAAGVPLRLEPEVLAGGFLRLAPA